MSLHGWDRFIHGVHVSRIDYIYIYMTRIEK